MDIASIVVPPSATNKKTRHNIDALMNPAANLSGGGFVAFLNRFCVAQPHVLLIWLPELQDEFLQFYDVLE